MGRIACLPRRTWRRQERRNYFSDIEVGGALQLPEVARRRSRRGKGRGRMSKQGTEHHEYTRDNLSGTEKERLGYAAPINERHDAASIAESIVYLPCTSNSFSYSQEYENEYALDMR